MPSINSTADLQQQLTAVQEQLGAHNVHQSLHSVDDVRLFVEHHVFVVWNFMSLLKALQRDLTCVKVPWVPEGNPVTRRLINQMVLEEESDVDEEGHPASHFEMYLRAMEECGADMQPINRLLAALDAGETVTSALSIADAPASVRQFVLATFEIIDSKKTHAIATAFAFGREDVAPLMFRHPLADLRQRFPGKLDTLTYYFERQRQLNEEVRTHLTQQIVHDLCQESSRRWQECSDAAVQYSTARSALWDGIQRALPTATSVVR